MNKKILKYIIIGCLGAIIVASVIIFYLGILKK